jgi:competence CoiA-like predicted nuclease
MAPRIVEARAFGDNMKLVPIEEAISQPWGFQYYCPACDKEVRPHRQRKPPRGPAPHFEHHRKNPECPLMKR